jgi:hypothetical protein
LIFLTWRFFVSTDSSSDCKAIFHEFITTTNSRQTFDICGEQHISRLEVYLSANELKMNKINSQTTTLAAECDFGRWLAWIPVHVGVTRGEINSG